MVIFEDKNRNDLVKELNELKRIIYGDSPDTKNLNSYKGLIKNQFTILLRNIGVLIE